MKCEVCGNEYDKAFEGVAAGQRHVFHSFECAIHRLAHDDVAAKPDDTGQVHRAQDDGEPAFEFGVLGFGHEGSITGASAVNAATSLGCRVGDA